jgi:hypothetical protein
MTLPKNRLREPGHKNPKFCRAFLVVRKVPPIDYFILYI